MPKTKQAKELPHKCEQCEKSFPYISTLMTHKLRHSGEKPTNVITAQAHSSKQDTKIFT